MDKFKKILFIFAILIFISGITVAGSAPTPAASEAKYTHFDKQAALKQLTHMEYEVTQLGETEDPFDNAYWDNNEPGIYVDIVSGEPLFSSTDKYDSGTGWPSFTQPIDNRYIVIKIHHHEFVSDETEVRSKYANSHLGDEFNDGPPPTGKRFCIDSAALRFIPASKLDQEGYSQYDHLFQQPHQHHPLNQSHLT